MSKETVKKDIEQTEVIKHKNSVRMRITIEKHSKVMEVSFSFDLDKDNGQIIIQEMKDANLDLVQEDFQYIESQIDNIVNVKKKKQIKREKVLSAPLRDNEFFGKLYSQFTKSISYSRRTCSLSKKTNTSTVNQIQQNIVQADTHLSLTNTSKGRKSSSEQNSRIFVESNINERRENLHATYYDARTKDQGNLIMMQYEKLNSCDNLLLSMTSQLRDPFIFKDGYESEFEESIKQPITNDSNELLYLRNQIGNRNNYKVTFPHQHQSKSMKQPQIDEFLKASYINSSGCSDSSVSIKKSKIKPIQSPFSPGDISPVNCSHISSIHYIQHSIANFTLSESLFDKSSKFGLSKDSDNISFDASTQKKMKLFKSIYNYKQKEDIKTRSFKQKNDVQYWNSDVERRNDFTQPLDCSQIVVYQMENNELPVMKSDKLQKKYARMFKNDIETLQIAFNKFTDKKINVDGHFGKTTEICVKKFQQVNGLDPNGVVNILTWNLVMGKNKQ